MYLLQSMMTKVCMRGTYVSDTMMLVVRVNQVAVISLSITDPSEVAVAFEQSVYTYSEGDSAASVCLELVALPAGGTEREITITIVTINMTAGLCGVWYS